jgi:glycine cleavage system regulatory protein
MRSSLVVCFMGRDRPGLVDRVARTALAHEANWEESRLVRLAGEFAGVVHLTVDARRADALERALRALPDLTTTVTRGAGSEEPETAVVMSLELLGDDRPGIVREVAGTLARLEVNIDELVTERYSAPHAGTMMFQASARLLLPPRLDPAVVRRALEAIASELMVELSLVTGTPPET